MNTEAGWSAKGMINEVKVGKSMHRSDFDNCGVNRNYPVEG